MDKKKQIQSIEAHKKQIDKIILQMQKVRGNHEKDKNNFLSAEINNKILNHELNHLNIELDIHEFCIECIKKREHLALVTDSELTNARKKKIIKLAKKNKIEIT